MTGTAVVGTLPIANVESVMVNGHGDRCVLCTPTDVIVCAVPFVVPGDVLTRRRFAEVSKLAVGPSMCVFFVGNDLHTIDLYTGQTAVYMNTPPGSSSAIGTLLVPRVDVVLGAMRRGISWFSPKWYNGVNTRLHAASTDETMHGGIESAVCNSSVLLVLSEMRKLYVMSLETSVSGLRWYPVGTRNPEYGVELSNAALASALQRTRSFAADEWAVFCVPRVSHEHFIRSGTTYFRPTMEQAPRLRKLHDSDDVGACAISEAHYAYESRGEVVVCSLSGGVERVRLAVRALPLRELRVSRLGDVAFVDAESDTWVQPLGAARRQVELRLARVALTDSVLIGADATDVWELAHRQWLPEVRAHLLNARGAATNNGRARRRWSPY